MQALIDQHGEGILDYPERLQFDIKEYIHWVVDGGLRVALIKADKLKISTARDTQLVHRREIFVNT